jgi:hypothetical protein
MSSAVDELLKNIESDLNLARRDLEGHLRTIRAALESYERAVLEQHALNYCQAHSLRKPRTAGIPPGAAAQALLHRVRLLPELGLETEKKESAERSSSEVSDPTLSEPEPRVSEVDDVTARFAAKFPALTQASGEGRLLVFGAFSGRKKTLPGPLDDVTDWIDTATDGNRLVSAAVRRITAGGVFSVIICDQAISHQHSEPITRAARTHKVPVAYAGKGGNSSLARALEALEEALG